MNHTESLLDYHDLDPNEFIQVNGQLMERDVANTVAKIQARWPNIRIQYLDPSLVEAELYDAPYQVCETLRDGTLRVIDQVWQLDDRVYKMLEMADAHGPNWAAVLERFEREARWARIREEKKKQEEMDVAEELTVAVLSSPKDTYVATDEITGKKVRYSSTKPAEVIS